MRHTHLVVMGVAGCGKSTVAEGLRGKLGWELAEGDEFHPAENIAKMSEGQPLADEDRWPWLDLIVDWTAQQDATGHDTIVTCSALRRVYRDRLRTAPGRTVFVHLVGAEKLLAHRLGARAGHFMPPTLLPSQLATLEPLEVDEDGFIVSIASDVPEIVDEAIRQLHLSTAPTTDPTNTRKENSGMTSFVLAALAGIAVIVALIVWLKVHPFLALIGGSAVMAITASVPFADLFKSFTAGLGSTLAGVGLLIILGSIVGTLLIASGGADVIVDTILDKTPLQRLPWAMALIAFVVGIPLFSRSASSS